MGRDVYCGPVSDLSVYMLKQRSTMLPVCKGMLNKAAPGTQHVG